MSSTAPSERPDPLEGLDQRRNRRVAAICAVTFFAMVGAAYAAVPLYKAFCQLTGFDGTVRRAQLAPDKVLARKLLIRFDVNVRDLPWTFTAEQASQNLAIGETGLAFFKVTNNSDKPMTGQAIYGVIPEQVGPYFQKLQCFCFSQQTIGPRQTVEFPVVYFVDPKFADDAEAKDAHEVTLSYTFYPAVLPAKPQVQAKASPLQTSQALGGTARAGL